jgi:hypothetical protein
MTKIMGPKGMRQLSVQTKDGERILNAGKDGMFNVSDPKLIKKLKAEGLGQASASGVSNAAGYPCKACGFGSFFKKCSRCGEING